MRRRKENEPPRAVSGRGRAPPGKRLAQEDRLILRYVAENLRASGIVNRIEVKRGYG